MRKFLTIIFILIFCGPANAGEDFQNSLENLYDKYDSINAYDYAFYLSEVGELTKKQQDSAIKCYRKLLREKKRSIYDNDKDCVKFRVSFGSQSDVWRLNYIKFSTILMDAILKNENGYFKVLPDGKKKKVEGNILILSDFNDLIVILLKLAKDSNW